MRRWCVGGGRVRKGLFGVGDADCCHGVVLDYLLHDVNAGGDLAEDGVDAVEVSGVVFA